MTKRQLIDQIREFNPTAQATFLAQFDEGALREYLEHLQGAAANQRHIHTFVRRRGDMRMVS